MPHDMPKDAQDTRHVLVFRDKLLLPSEGFIKSHYISFDQLNPVYLANKIGWRADELDGAKHLTAAHRFWHGAVQADRVFNDV